ncbi:hypothetical protein Tco_0390068 [Tanacetum coccineum]
MKHEIFEAYTSVEAAQEDIETLQVELGAADESISYLDFRLEDTKTRLEASEAKEIEIIVRIRALEDFFGPPNER